MHSTVPAVDGVLGWGWRCHWKQHPVSITFMLSAVFPWALSLLETFHITHFFQHRDPASTAPLWVPLIHILVLHLPKSARILTFCPHCYCSGSSAPAFTGHSVSDLVYVNKPSLSCSEVEREGWNRAVGSAILNYLKNHASESNSEANAFWWKSFPDIAPSTDSHLPGNAEGTWISTWQLVFPHALLRTRLYS